MPRTYGITSTYTVPDAMTFGALPGSQPMTGKQGGSISLMPNPFTCCGLTSLTGFGRVYGLNDFAEKAAFLAGLRNINHGRTHFVYVVNPTQKYGEDHKTLIEAGAKLIASFPNLQGGSHSGYMLEMYLWNPKDAVGVFYDNIGGALTEDPRIKKMEAAAKPVPAPKPKPKEPNVSF